MAQWGGNGDETGSHKIRKVFAEEAAPVLDHAEHFIKRLKFWLTIAISLIVVGFTAAMWFARFAKVDDIDKVHTELKEHNAALQDHTVKLEVMDQRQRSVDKKMDWANDALFELSRRPVPREGVRPSYRLPPPPPPATIGPNE